MSSGRHGCVDSEAGDASMKETPITMSGNHPRLILDLLKTQTRRVISKYNSVIGEGGDWAKLCWDGSQIYRDTCSHGRTELRKAPLPFIDGKPETGQYLHIPYNYSDDQVIFRVYPKWDVGNRLWVKETHSLYEYNPGKFNVIYRQKWLDEGQIDYLQWRPSIFMFRKDSWILLEITEVRVERVQDISEADAKAEGVNPFLLDKLIGGTKYKMLKTYHHDFYPLVDHADEGEIITFQCPNMGFARLSHTQWKDGQDPVFRIPAKEVFDYVGAVEPDYINGYRILWDSLNGKKHPWESNPWVWVISFKMVKDGSA